MRTVHTKLGLVVGLSVGAVLFGGVGCAKHSDDEQRTNAPPPAATERAANDQAGQMRVMPSERLESALRGLDRGSEVSAIKSELEAVLADARTSPDQQDEARLGLSRARELLGDKDGAIGAVEEVLASHPESGRFASRELAERRLRLLLTGAEKERSSFSASEHYAPVARALADTFQADDRGETFVEVLAFGRGGEHLEEIGGLAVAAAKRDALRQTCTLCEDNLKMHQSISRSGSWVDIPRSAGEVDPGMPQVDRSLVIVFFDLEANKVPSRYDEYLAIPSADIIQRLEKGEGVIAARERKGAKPVIVIAAPRTAQLRSVEDAFAKLTQLPKEPVSVPVEAQLAPEEIQGVVRASFGSVRKCYEQLLTRDAKAAGNVAVRFEIGGDGLPKSVTTDDKGDAKGPKTTIVDPAMNQCITDMFTKLRFPASGRNTTVTYPLAFSPGDDGR